MERKMIKHRILADPNIRFYKSIQFPLFCILLVLGLLCGFGAWISYIDTLSGIKAEIIWWVLAVWLSTIYAILLSILFWKFLNRPFELLENLLDIGDSLSEKLLLNTKIITTPDEILTLSTEIYANNTQLAYMKKVWWYFLRKSTNEFLMHFFDEKQKEILEILFDCKSDLQIQIEQNIESINLQKNEVTSTIQWTTELNEVWELQKARLDRQIEQFEELQRVLVKV